MNVEKVLTLLSARQGLPPIQVLHCPEVDSTNTRLREAAGGGGPLDRAWTVLVADWQREGLGSKGRGWECSNSDGLLMSLRLDLSLGMHALPLVGHWAALALCLALEERIGERAARVWWKWPNDLVLEDEDGRGKVAGILVQSQVQGDLARVVLGMGVNLDQTQFPDGLRQPARSLRQAGCRVDREELLAGILIHLADLGAPRRPATLPQALLSRDLLASRPAFLREGGELNPLKHGHEADGPLRLHTRGGPILLAGGGLTIERLTREDLWCSLEA